MITPTAPKLRKVLLLLALQSGRAVRTDQLISELWDDRPPPSANTTLQTYIYQLRKLVSRAGESETVLATVPSGYVLQLPEDAVDVRRFEWLVAEGRNLASRGNVKVAAERFATALHLWRGPMLTAIDAGPVLRAEIVRLEELRKTVLEERIDAELILGRHQQLIGELAGLVSSHPTHEGLQGKLMLALYRSGRRSEALAVYREVRALLADELGLEPSLALQTLHRDILADDPRLDRAAPEHETAADTPASRIADSPPSLLPANTWIAGREAELEELREALQDDGQPAVLALQGPPGSGKSALCIHVAHQVRGRYPDGQFYAELTDADGGPVPVAEVLADFLRTIGCSESAIPPGTVDRARMFRSWTADRKVLIVLDDLSCAEQLGPLLPSGPGCAVFLTTRRRLVHRNITRLVSLAPLDRDPASRLMERLLGRARVRRERDALLQLVDRCEGLPAALIKAAGQLALRPHWPISRLVYEFDGSTVSAALQRTYPLLSQVARKVFHTVATGDGSPVTARAAAAQLRMPSGVVEPALEELVEFHLVDVEPDHGTGQFNYGVRPIFRLAARLQASASGLAGAAAPERSGTPPTRPPGPRTAGHAVTGLAAASGLSLQSLELPMG